MIRVLELYIQTFNFISSILFAKIKYIGWPIRRDDRLELLFSVVISNELIQLARKSLSNKFLIK